MSDYTPPTLVTPTPGGNPGDGSMTGSLRVQSGISSGGSGVLLSADSGNTTIISLIGGGNLAINTPGGAITLNQVLNFQKKFYVYNNVLVAGMGVPPIYGDDARTGLTAVDSAAKTLYTTTAAGQTYRLMGRILATAGTTPSATYTIKWTEGGATITKTLTISALDSDSDLSILIQPDNGTTITAQLTAISGTGTTVNVAATVEELV